ncbi:MAG: TonB-dependent receptor [Bacteroidota bacterium]|nr:TonB-dependent receptor [Bacteroidota bacterium]
MKCFLTVVKKPLQSKVLLAMKLTALLTFFFTLNVSANGFGQEKISLKVKKAEISGVLRSIEKQTNYRFLYNDKLQDIREKVSINVREASINDVLALILEKTRLLYQVMENNLIVIKEDPNAPPRIPDIVVRGKVTGEGGAPIAGASVQVKGTKTGTTTDNEGNFAISVPNANVTLIISSVGYDTKEIALEGKTDITVGLATSTKIMDQVVVIGYGTASKRDLTGSIVKISGKEIEDKPNTNPVASLQSKVAGLYIVNNGTPGQEPDIRIRGTVSLGQVHPLYIVDGVFQDNINYVNPSDIESIEILKDPSSLAIFGVRGATGVIAISTKRAKAGQTVINFSNSYGFKTLVDKIKMASADQFNTLFQEENTNNGIPTPNYSALNSNTDWIDAVTRTGHFNNSSLSLSSSTDKNKFMMNVGYISDEGILIHEKLDKILLGFSDEVKLNKAIKLGVNFNGSRQHNPYDATSRLDDARKAMPNVSGSAKTFKVKDPYSSDSLNVPVYSGLDVALQNSGVVNPVLEIENTWDKNISYEYRYVASAFVDISFLKDFNFRSTWYADISNVESRTYSPLYYAYDPLTNIPFLYSNKTTVSQNNQTYRKFQQDYILTYKKQFGDHGLTVMGGFTTYYFGNFGLSGTSTQGSSASDRPIPNDSRLWYLNNGFGILGVNGATSNQTENTTVSSLARVLYNYKGKYYLNASFRDDASSRIAPQNRHQKFWAVGGAWELTKENFMQSVRQINFLKLKGSVGVLGNQSTYGAGFDPNYLYTPGLVSGAQVPFGTNLVNIARPAFKPNPDLKWETVTASEIGVEAAAFNNRLHFEANYYSKVTKDMMTLIYISGQDPILENGGKIKNWGEEFSASWAQSINKDLTINISGNITFLKNKVLSVAADLPGGLILEEKANNNSAEARTVAGYPIGSFFGYVVEGLYQSNRDILTSPPASSIGSYRPGDFKFKDVNGDGVIDANDRTVIGNPSPKFIYGGSIGATYKRISLSIDLGGVYGNDVFRIWGSLESPFQRVNYPAFKTERWHGAGTSNWEPIISQQDRFNYNGSTYNIEDGSYLRIRNLQVGYDFPAKMISRAYIKNLRIFANAQNLKTWKHNKGYTPEFGGSATAFGFDQAGGAIPRVITFGLNVTF